MDQGPLEDVMGLKYNTLKIIEDCINTYLNHSSEPIRMLELGDQLIHEKKESRTGKQYFTSKGIDHYSVDLNGLHGSIIKDLTDPSQFIEWHGCFDIITNAGTTEHVEPLHKQWEAFSIIHDCLKPNGVFVHILPEVTSRDENRTWVDHCHYYYSFEFFKKLAKRCNYEIILNQMLEGNIIVALIKKDNNKFLISRNELLEKISVRNLIAKENYDINNIVNKNTMVDRHRISELAESLQLIYSKNLSGDIVECGTWRGGLAALVLDFIIKNKIEKKLWIYDTFQGMTEPSTLDGEKAYNEYQSKKIENLDYANWCRATLDIVKSTLCQVDNNFDSYCKFIVGKVEDTLNLNQNIPKEISLLRLDTDWYESTKIELQNLYPRVVEGGVIIIDDYSTWEGSKLATDEYLASLNQRSFKKILSSNGSLIIYKETYE